MQSVRNGHGFQGLTTPPCRLFVSLLLSGIAWGSCRWGGWRSPGGVCLVRMVQWPQVADCWDLEVICAQSFLAWGRLRAQGSQAQQPEERQ